MMAWLLCCLLNAAQSQGQEQTVRLDDLNLMLGSQPAARQTILEKMHSFHQAQAIALSVTLLSEDDVYQAFSMAEQTRWLGQSSPALAITIWHDAKFRTYQSAARCKSIRLYLRDCHRLLPRLLYHRSSEQVAKVLLHVMRP